ncbi:MAG: FixH family protein [Thermomicrobiales bacterium]
MTTMFRSLPRPRFIALLVAAILAMTSVMMPFAASAHESRTVATDYEFVVGFVNEPAVQGEMNGIILEVSKAGEPVTGLDQTLKAEIILGDQKKEVALSPVWKEDGSYKAMFIPTQPGDYTFHFFGTIEGTQIDETFTSSPEGFDSVAPRSDYEFPATGN